MLVIVAGVPMASAAPFEVGGYGGATSSNPVTFSCVRALLAAEEPCSNAESNPHYDQAGIMLGAYFRLPLHPAALLEADLLYAQKGLNGGPNATARTDHYLELPLLAEIDLIHWASPARAFALAGLSPAIRVACTAVGTIFDNDLHMAVHYDGSCADLPPPINREPALFDLGFVVGAGIGWEFSFGTVEVQARFTRGLVTIEDGVRTYNRTVFFMAGFGLTRD